MGFVHHRDARERASRGGWRPREPPRPSEARDWRRGWDSNPTGLFRFCKLRIRQCRQCRECRRRRGALPAIARQLLQRGIGRHATGGRSTSSGVLRSTGWTIATTARPHSPTAVPIASSAAAVKDADIARSRRHRQLSRVRVADALASLERNQAPRPHLNLVVRNLRSGSVSTGRKSRERSG